jgi:hypothetical protein
MALYATPLLTTTRSGRSRLAIRRKVSLRHLSHLWEKRIDAGTQPLLVRPTNRQPRLSASRRNAGK